MEMGYLGQGQGEEIRPMREAHEKKPERSRKHQGICSIRPTGKSFLKNQMVRYLGWDSANRGKDEKLRRKD